MFKHVKCPFCRVSLQILNFESVSSSFQKEEGFHVSRAFSRHCEILPTVATIQVKSLRKLVASFTQQQPGYLGWEQQPADLYIDTAGNCSQIAAQSSCEGHLTTSACICCYDYTKYF